MIKEELNEFYIDIVSVLATQNTSLEAYVEFDIENRHIDFVSINHTCWTNSQIFFSFFFCKIWLKSKNVLNMVIGKITVLIGKIVGLAG